MNLLLSEWLPVLMPDGAIRRIAPLSVPTSGALRIAHPRPDFSALATELVVCLFQSLAAPAEKYQRAGWLRGEAVDLDAFTEAAPLFNLFGDGPRFMQSPEPVGKSGSAASLVYESPLEKTKHDNMDIFVPRNHMGVICAHCAPLGLFLNQSHARTAGKGYFAPPRGGSALTALIQAESLWKTIVLNLLPQQEFDERFAIHDAPKNIFPWSTGIESFTSPSVSPEQMGSHAVLWWCPVALYLEEENNAAQEPCSLCGDVHPTIVRTLHRAATAARPPEGSRHPHTVYCFDAKNNVEYPLMTPKGGTGLEGWLALNLGPEGKAYGPLPAIKLLTSRQASSVQLWMFGGEMSKASFLSWFDEVSPLFVDDEPAVRSARNAIATQLLKTTLTRRYSLYRALQKNLSDNKKRLAPLPRKQATGALLAQFEDRARRALVQVLEGLDPETVELSQDAARRYELRLSQTAAALFDSNVIYNPLNVDQTRRILQVRQKLEKELFPPLKSASKNRRHKPEKALA